MYIAKYYVRSAILPTLIAWSIANDKVEIPPEDTCILMQGRAQAIFAGTLEKCGPHWPGGRAV